MAVSTLLLAAMLKTTLMTRRQIRTERHVRQTEWLVQAGAERATFRLEDDDQYVGEVWSLTADTIVGTDPGVVTISVSRDATDRVNVQVVAEYPSDSVTSIRRTQEFLIDLNQN
jgi:type II secretory pathway component PulK